MSAEKSKDLVKTFIEEVINKKNFDLLENYCSMDFTLHGSSMGVIKGLKEFKRVNTEAGGGIAFPDFKVSILDIIGEEDRVVVRYTMNATHQGKFMGVAPTGKKIHWNAMVLYQIENNKISKGWLWDDTLGLMMQIGVRELPQK